jgi:HD-GYP domain-containing protein (c-di-GMP phosphodiesterase class II)
MNTAELELRLHEHQTLLELGLALAETLEPHRVLELALEKAEEFCAAETSSIWELDEDSDELFFRVVRGRAAGEIADLRVPVGTGIVGSVVESGRAERIEEVASDPRWRGDASPRFDTHAMLVVPLISRGRVVGVLQLLNAESAGGFTEDDLRRMQLFAGPLAHALENARLYVRLEETFVESVTALAEAVEKRDPYTGGHLQRVVAYSLLLGDELELPAEELEQLRLGATLHDIGKIAVPDAVLRKPSRLDADELEVMRRHPVDGSQIVGRIRSLAPIVPIVRHHHEQLDGHGYPDGLAGAGIPLPARIVAVADTFDAMTTSRPYRDGLAPERAAEAIRDDAGTRLCDRVAGAFERIYSRGGFRVTEGERIAASLSAHRSDGYNPA